MAMVDARKQHHNVVLALEGQLRRVILDAHRIKKNKLDYQISVQNRKPNGKNIKVFGVEIGPLPASLASRVKTVPITEVETIFNIYKETSDLYTCDLHRLHHEAYLTLKQDDDHDILVIVHRTAGTEEFLVFEKSWIPSYRGMIGDDINSTPGDDTEPSAPSAPPEILTDGDSAVPSAPPAPPEILTDNTGDGAIPSAPPLPSERQPPHVGVADAATGMVPSSGIDFRSRPKTNEIETQTDNTPSAPLLPDPRIPSRPETNVIETQTDDFPQTPTPVPPEVPPPSVPKQPDMSPRQDEAVPNNVKPPREKPPGPILTQPPDMVQKGAILEYIRHIWRATTGFIDRNYDGGIVKEDRGLNIETWKGRNTHLFPEVSEPINKAVKKFVRDIDAKKRLATVKSDLNEIKKFWFEAVEKGVVNIISGIPTFRGDPVDATAKPSPSSNNDNYLPAAPVVKNNKIPLTHSGTDDGSGRIKALHTKVGHTNLSRRR